MNNKKGNIAVIAIIIVFVAITTGVITWLVATKSQAPVQQPVLQQAPVSSPREASVVIPQESKNGVAIGKICNNNLEPNLDNKGLQCYFMDTSDGGRQGIWIKPDIHASGISATIPNNSYDSLIDLNKIKTYQTPDHSISFSIPKSWKVNDENWQNGGVVSVMTDPADASVTIQISKIKDNAITIEDRVNDAKKSSSSILESTDTINGSEVTMLETAPTSNLGEGGYLFFFKKNGYYFEVEAPKTGYAALDFPIEYLLSTIKIK